MSSVATMARSDVKSDHEENDAPANEWTIMIFFAGDPHLSPSMTAQLKSIKDAGFQKDTKVLIHYDPNEKGVATTTFDINRKEKEDTLKINGKNRGTRIGDGKDPFVRNLLDDSISNGARRSQTAAQALRTFLSLGLREENRARHYVIFCVGHGVIVGNDFFLPDKEPNSAISLQELGKILSDFKGCAEGMNGEGEVELIGLHSCSMSAIEVAYQLKGAAKCLMATEGISFVSSWPYRQLMKKVLKTIDDAKKAKEKVDVTQLITEVQRLALHNSTDFMFSGLSADLCLSSLDPVKIDALTAPIKVLVKELKEGLKDPRGLELITLAHLKAQSYYQETYTDLYDFCFCLEDQCLKEGGKVQKDMAAACGKVKEMLEESPDNVIIQSDFFGPLFQYSHGYSVFFPWSRPASDNPEDDMIKRYKNYEFTKVFKEDSWLSFLEAYFAATKRHSREDEDKVAKKKEEQAAKEETNEETSVRSESSNNGTSAVSGMGSVDSLPLPEKTTPTLDAEKTTPTLTDAMSCACSVKNYPMEFFLSERASQSANPNACKPEETPVHAPAKS